MIKIAKTNDLMHYGMPRRSGRYPFGSGERPYQRGGAPHAKFTTDADIKKGLSILNKNKKICDIPMAVVTNDTNNKYTLYNDYKIPEGTKMYRLSEKKIEPYNDKYPLKYVTIKNNDWPNYYTPEFIFTNGKKGSAIKSKDDVTEATRIKKNVSLLTLQATNDLKIASSKQVIKNVLELENKDGKYKSALKTIDKMGKTLSESSMLNRDPLVYLAKTRIITEDQAIDINSKCDLVKSPYRHEIIKNLKKQGYNGVVDYYDRHGDKGWSDTPTILFSDKNNYKQIREQNLVGRNSEGHVDMMDPYQGSKDKHASYIPKHILHTVIHWTNEDADAKRKK